MFFMLAKKFLVSYSILMTLIQHLHSNFIINNILFLFESHKNNLK